MITWSPRDQPCKPQIIPAVPEPIPCMMFASTSSHYKHEFPSLERKTDPVSHVTTKPSVLPTEVQPDGKLKPLSQAEEVLNWQSENAKAQNSNLKKIDEKIDHISIQVDESEKRLQYLSSKMRKYYKKLLTDISQLEEELRHTKFGEEMNAKDREIRKLSAQIRDLDAQIDYLMKAEKTPAKSLDPDPISLFAPPPLASYTSPFQTPPPYFTTPSFQPPSFPSAYRGKPKEIPSYSKRRSTKMDFSPVSSKSSSSSKETQPPSKKISTSDENTQPVEEKTQPMQSMAATIKNHLKTLLQDFVIVNQMLIQNNPQELNQIFLLNLHIPLKMSLPI